MPAIEAAQAIVEMPASVVALEEKTQEMEESKIEQEVLSVEEPDSPTASRTCILSLHA